MGITLKENSSEAARWFLQAENDLAFAKLGLREGYFSQVCFQCQQIAEKAIKSIRYNLGERIVFGHSLLELAEPLEFSDGKMNELAVLDQYYIPTRYPNGLPGGVPYKAYTKDQATNAVSVATSIVELARSKLELP